MSSSRFCDLLGLELPVIQSPMAGHQDSALALAVTGAGGLGSLPCATLDAETIRTELAAIRDAGPVNVNFFCHAEPQPDPAREAAWLERLRPYYEELGIELPTPGGPSGRAPFDEATVELLAEFEPAVVSFHFGLPQPDLLARLKCWGAKVLASATTVDEAVWLEQRGADVIIAQGVEAGGHRGMFLSDDVTTAVGTLALVRQVVAAVDVPVVAAGGINDAAGVAAALALGAAGVQVGTAYLLCPEARISEVHRTALQSMTARHTALTNVFTGRPARGIVNRAMRELGPLHPDAPAFPRAAAAITPLRQAAERQGSGDFTPLWCGQHPPSRSIPAAELTRELAG